eukprot:355191-Chlamydomonas_euryale.AAC.7
MHTCLQFAFVRYRLRWVPSPLPVDAPAAVFSEARAMAHVVHLTKVIGDHQVWRREWSAGCEVRGGCGVSVRRGAMARVGAPPPFLLVDHQVWCWRRVGSARRVWRLVSGVHDGCADRTVCEHRFPGRGCAKTSVLA